MALRYISVDIEASGPTPGKYSMLSFGACVVGDTSKTFYRELKPISDNFIPEAIRIGSLGIAANKGNSASDPKTFDPVLALENLRRLGVGPSLAMNDFYDWVELVAGGLRPVLVSDGPVFDGMFIAWYADNFCERGNPFKHTGFSANDFCKGLQRDLRANLKSMGLKAPKGLKHNSGYDAFRNAVLFQQVLNGMHTKRR